MLVAAARRQQAAYRAIGRHDDRNVDARQQITAMAHVKDTMPAWRINAPTPSEELLSDYREAESASGVGWNYLAANGFANDHDHTIYRYKNANEYVQAVNDYAAVPAADPATFAGYYRWDVYYSTACDVLLPVGYAATSPIPLATIWRPTRNKSSGTRLIRSTRGHLRRIDDDRFASIPVEPRSRATLDPSPGQKF